MFEDIKGGNQCRKSKKDREYNVQNTKEINNDLQNTNKGLRNTNLRKQRGEVHCDTRLITVKRHEIHHIWILHWTPGYPIEYK